MTNRPQPGDRINNYLLDELVAAGSFGEVYKAHHHVFDETVAIKIPTEPQYVRQLQREGMAIHGLRHPNIVRAMDMDPYGEPPYLIMEYVDGQSVGQLLDGQEGGLPIAPTVAVLYGTLSALAVAHEAGVIHRDIKPANILVAGKDDVESVTPERVKVTDFGLGHLKDGTAESMIHSGSINTPEGRRIAGTMVYMSPEQRDGGDIDGRSDLYSVGVVLHEMLTGVLPQGTDSPSSIRSEVPRWLDELFGRSYTRRDHRFASAREMQAVIEHYWAPALTWSEPGPGPPPPPPSAVSGQCATCGGDVKPGDQFCIHCGLQLAERVPRCPKCYRFIEQGEIFCTECGTDQRMMA